MKNNLKDIHSLSIRKDSNIKYSSLEQMLTKKTRRNSLSVENLTFILSTDVSQPQSTYSKLIRQLTFTNI